MDQNPPINGSMSLVLRVEDWSPSQRQQFMDVFSRSMDSLSAPMRQQVLASMAKEDVEAFGSEIEDEPLYRLSFSPGFDGQPLRVSIKAPIPAPIRRLSEQRVEEKIQGLEQKLEGSWMVQHLMPALGWLLRKSHEDRQPKNIVNNVVSDERQRLSQLSSGVSHKYWMTHFGPALSGAVLKSSYEALLSLALPSPIAPVLIEGNGRVLEVGLEGVTRSAELTHRENSAPSVKIKV